MRNISYFSILKHLVLSEYHLSRFLLLESLFYYLYVLLFLVNLGCDVINFKIKLKFLVKPFFRHDLKVKKTFIYLENGKSF